jgi:hypothetical protein
MSSHMVDFGVRGGSLSQSAECLHSSLVSNAVVCYLSVLSVFTVHW